MAETVLDAALACVDDFYARMFRNWPSAITQTRATHTLSYSGDRYLTGANHLWPRDADALSPDVLVEAEHFFSPYGAAWSVIYADTAMPDARTRLTDNNYFLRWQSPLMVLDAPPPRERIAPGVRIERATTQRQLREAQSVMSEAFSTGAAVNDRVVRPSHLDEPGVFHYLLTVEGEPASCATLALCNGVGGVWNVGTRYAFRRKGHARALMVALLADLADEGRQTSVLMASPSGRPMYDALGYRQIATVCYMAPPAVHQLRRHRR
jgi:hypothetical protein